MLGVSNLAATDIPQTSLRTSARNQWLGTIRALNVGMVTTDAQIGIDAGVTCVAQVTTHSASALGLKPGLQVCALVKATAIKIEPLARARTTANLFRGVVRSFAATEGYAELSIRLSKKCTVSAIAEHRSARSTFAPGADVNVSFSPQSVLLVMPA